MCFYNDDYDWAASVSEVTESNADTKARCDECHAAIEPSQWRRHIFLQQYLECRNCTPSWENGDDPEPCEPGECDFGEHYHHDICENCAKVLNAIKTVELAEGCAPGESQPSLGGLWPEIEYQKQIGKYRAEAIRAYPEIETWLNGRWPVDMEEEVPV